MPKCGFSKQTVAILAELKAEYGTFDILTDDEVTTRHTVTVSKTSVTIFLCL